MGCRRKHWLRSRRGQRADRLIRASRCAGSTLDCGAGLPAFVNGTIRLCLESASRFIYLIFEGAALPLSIESNRPVFCSRAAPTWNFRLPGPRLWRSPAAAR